MRALIFSAFIALATVFAYQNCGMPEDPGQGLMPITDPVYYKSQMDQLSQQISLITRLNCNTFQDCDQIAMGHKACGGPQTYLVYSKFSTSAESLQKLVNAYTQTERTYNEQAGVVSNCMMVMPFTRFECINGQCQGRM
jgi:hypothetical protein